MRAALAAAGALLVAAFGGFLVLRRSLPSTSGTVTLAALRAPVDVVRDSDGVPHLFAEHEHDAFAALGFVHAQDRLWQMEVQRRAAQGRLAELFGPPALPRDRFLRTLGLARIGTRAWAELPSGARESIAAYVAGVNACIETRGRLALPPEFLALGIRPERWTPPDVLAWSKLMAWNLSANLSAELLRLDLAGAASASQLAELLPGYPAGGATMVRTARSDGAPSMALPEDVWAWLGSGGPFANGSNSWVVSGSMTASGRPALANDPHLGTSIPALWYLAHMSAGRLDVIGATVPGLPAVLIGRTRAFAWGVTGLGADSQDLFREKLDDGGTAAEYAGALVPLNVRTETLRVRGQAAVEMRVRTSRHGPLISDALNASADRRGADPERPPLPPLALAWPGFDERDASLDGFLRLNMAAGWPEFKAALESIAAPTQSFLYADREGHIGIHVAGHIPVRARGDGSSPVEGWSGENEWRGWVAFDELPQAFDPAEGFIVSANNCPVDAAYPHFLGREWQPPYRATRIAALLGGRSGLTVDDHERIQADTVSLHARELLPLLLPLVGGPETAQERQALDLLSRWEARMDGARPEAVLFAAWTRRLPRALVADELGHTRVGLYEHWFPFVSRFLVETLSHPENPWCDVRSTPAQEDCRTIARDTFRQALAELAAEMGADVSTWRWDRQPRLIFAHQPFDNVPALRPLFSRRVPNGGDESTVHPGSFSLKKPFEQRFGPTYRQVVDLAEEGGAFLQTTGQSGHFLSPRYDDYLPDWQGRRYRPMRMDRAAVTAAAEATLRLVPAALRTYEAKPFVREPLPRLSSR